MSAGESSRGLALCTVSPSCRVIAFPRARRLTGASPAAWRGAGGGFVKASPRKLGRGLLECTCCPWLQVQALGCRLEGAHVPTNITLWAPPRAGGRAQVSSACEKREESASSNYSQRLGNFWIVLCVGEIYTKLLSSTHKCPWLPVRDKTKSSPQTTKGCSRAGLLLPQTTWDLTSLRCSPLQACHPVSSFPGGGSQGLKRQTTQGVVALRKSGEKKAPHTSSTASSRPGGERSDGPREPHRKATL